MDFSCEMRSTCGYVLILTVLIVQLSLTGSAQLTHPMNTVSFVGDRVKMECSSNSSLPVEWEFASAGSTDVLPIYTVGQITEHLSSRYKIETGNNTRYDIIIESVDLVHAGTYKCTPLTETYNALSDSAELTVLASDPVCETNASALNAEIVEGEYIQMQCKVNYTGNGILIMQWTRSSGQHVDANKVYAETLSTVTSSLTIQLHSSDNGATFTCRTRFNLTSIKVGTTLNPGGMRATNNPLYQHSWNFTASVLYAPRNLTIVAKKSLYEIGDRLHCWADGNPHPVYRWMDTETNRIIYGPVLTIDDHMNLDQEYIFRCTACNTSAHCIEQMSDTVIFTVTGGSQYSTEHSIIITIITIGSFVSVALAWYLWNNRCPFKKDNAESVEDHLTVRQCTAQTVHSPGAEGSNLKQRLPLSLYAKVRRKENGNESCSVVEGGTGHLPRHRDLPVYTEVVKNRNGSNDLVGPRETAQTTANQYRLPPMTLTGADGTQYMDVTSIRYQTSRDPARNHPMFSVVDIYASIDHTVNVPPPPLPPKRQ